MAKLKCAPSLKILGVSLLGAGLSLLPFNVGAETYTLSKSSVFAVDKSIASAKSDLIIEMQKDIKSRLSNYVISDEKMDGDGNLQETFDIISMAKMSVETIDQKVNVLGDGRYEMWLEAVFDVDEEGLSQRVKAYYAELDARNELNKVKADRDSILRRIEKIESEVGEFGLKDHQLRELEQLRSQAKFYFSDKGSFNFHERLKDISKPIGNSKERQKKLYVDLMNAIRGEFDIRYVDMSYCDKGASECSNMSNNRVYLHLHHEISPMGEKIASDFLGTPIESGQVIDRKQFLAMSPLEKSDFLDAVEILTNYEGAFKIGNPVGRRVTTYPIYLSGARDFKRLNISKIRENPELFPRSGNVYLMYSDMSKTIDLNNPRAVTYYFSADAHRLSQYGGEIGYAPNQPTIKPRS